MLGCGTLSSDDRWALMTFIQREVGSGFEADPSGVLDAGLRSSLVAQVERVAMLDSCRAIESEWDESLREKFDDLPDALGDHAAVGFISAVLWECLRSEASASARSQEVRANIADWLCRGVEMLGMRINANAVRSDLLSAGATEHSVGAWGAGQLDPENLRGARIHVKEVSHLVVGQHLSLEQYVKGGACTARRHFSRFSHAGRGSTAATRSAH